MLLPKWELYKQGVRDGIRHKLMCVMSEHLKRIINQAECLRSSFVEERNTKKFRKAKLWQLSILCQYLEEGFESPWFIQAVKTHSGCFEQKRAALVKYHTKLEDLWRQFLAMDSDWKNSDFDPLFAEIARVIESMTEKLSDVNRACIENDTSEERLEEAKLALTEFANHDNTENKGLKT